LENILLSDRAYVKRKYMEFYDKHGYVPKIFVPYDCAEITNFAHTIATSSGTPSGIGSHLIIEEIEIE